MLLVVCRRADLARPDVGVDRRWEARQPDEVVRLGRAQDLPTHHAPAPRAGSPRSHTRRD